MNDLGILIDVTHATPQAQMQIIETSRKPVVCSHTSMAAVSGVGMSDETLKALAAKGGLVGIIGTSSGLSKKYRQWIADHPEQARTEATPVNDMIEFKSSLTPEPLTHGEFGNWLDVQMRQRHKKAFQAWLGSSEEAAVAANAEDWAAHVAHAVTIAGAQHVGIGLDLVGGRSCVPATAIGYPELLTALGRHIGENIYKRSPQKTGCEFLKLRIAD